MELDSRLVLIVSLSSFFFFNSAETLCVPRNSTYLSGIPNPSITAPSPTGLSQSPVSLPNSPTQQPTSPASSPAPAEELAAAPKISTISSVPATSPAPAPLKPVNPISGLVDRTINNACHETEYPDLCFSTIKPFLNGVADLETILDEEIQVCKNGTLAASADALKRAQDPNTDPDMASVLKDCNDSYKDALDNLKQAEDAMKARDIGTVNTMLSAAMTDIGDCDDETTEMQPDQPQPMSHEDATLTHLTSNCLAIASLIKW
ncbi:hypothetical protein NE237_011346 [Protea cynaroides]|uniref:Pectinesterase inhibitor domain-containing protein n=1 Tax=Protea cynaroides TaxID=273540 RepID=A0A9Q0GXS0_9MAGN|nr:hypothetical protein NE237_011346 [Protea cynaroides]